MTSEQWRRVKAIVLEAREREPAARAAFVADACAGDEDMRREVTSLLTAMEGAELQFEEPALNLAAAGPLVRAAVLDVAPESGLDTIGRRIGPYEIRRPLGRGGMGAVYLASRADREFAHDVALKIIKRGMDTDAVVRRFR